MIRKSLLSVVLFFSLLAFQQASANRLFIDKLTPYEVRHYKFMLVKDLAKRMKEGQDVMVVDVRSAYAYQMEHIPGAVNVPLMTFKNTLYSNPLPRTGIIVTYCSCPRHEAEMAWDLMKGLGYRNAFVLQEGLPGWKQLGYKTVGTLANEPVTPYWVVGYALNSDGKPKANVEVRLLQPQTQQLEIGDTDGQGFYAMRASFYGLTPGEQMQVIIGNDVVFYALGSKTSPWGTRVDDHDGRMSILPSKFVQTLKEKKLI